MSYTPPANNAVNFALTVYTPPVNTAASFEFASALNGYIKVWLGSWILKPVKVWTGAAWVQKPIKYWNGSIWKIGNQV